MHKRILIASLTLVGVLLVIGLLPIHGEAAIYDTAVRLHVLADSDSEEDQALKYKVRDAILATASPMLEGCRTQEEAIARLEENREALSLAARAVIAEEGREDSVEILLGREEYPTRSYDSFCFPAGEYVSLRVRIGSGEGKNWWCCLFPPLCIGAASAEDACISVGLTPSQYKIITESDKPVYRVRFKLLELFESWR